MSERVDIQELKKTAESLKGYHSFMVPVSTILALIEENERLREALWRIKWGSGTGETARLLRADEMQSIAHDALEGAKP